jgi:hypothetical protein
VLSSVIPYAIETSFLQAPHAFGVTGPDETIVALGVIGLSWSKLQSRNLKPSAGEFFLVNRRSLLRDNFK